MENTTTSFTSGPIQQSRFVILDGPPKREQNDTEERSWLRRLIRMFVDR